MLTHTHATGAQKERPRGVASREISQLGEKFPFTPALAARASIIDTLSDDRLAEAGLLEGHRGNAWVDNAARERRVFRHKAQSADLRIGANLDANLDDASEANRDVAAKARTRPVLTTPASTV